MGFALSYTPAVAMVGMYFSRRKALAYGLAMSGSGIGTFVLAPVVQLLIEYYSWRGALLILGGLVSHLCVCAALLKPLEEQKGYVVNLPDGKQGDAKLKDVELPDSKLTNEKPVGEILKDCKRAGDVEQADQKSAGSMHRMNKKSDSMCFLLKHLEDNTANTQPADSQPVTQDPPTTKVEHSESLHVMDEKSDNMCFLSKHSDGENTTCENTKPLTQIPPSTKVEHSVPADPTSPDSKLAVSKLTDAKLCDSKLQGTKLVEAKLLEMNWVSPRTGSERSCPCLPPMEEYGFLLMPDFLLLSVSFLFLAYGCSVPFVYLVPYALSVGVSHQQAALLISILGVIGIVGNITFGWMTDLR